MNAPRHPEDHRLSPEEQQRYARQTILPEIGAEGQARLKVSSVLVVGVGGLGSPVALYLAAAGVGRIGLVDDDRVETSNLHRQVLYSSCEVGRTKVEAAAERLRALNPHVEVVPHPVRLTDANALELVRGYNVVADGTDTFATRYAVNDACVRAGVPNAFASVSRFTGQAAVFCAPGGPCYRCLFPEPPPPGAVPSCAEGGVLGALPGLRGTVQATETLKLLLGLGDTLAGRLLLVDALAMRFRTLAVERDPRCPACGERRAAPTHTPVPRPSMAAAPKPTVPEITVRELKKMRDEGKEPFVLDVRQPEEFAAANIGGALVPMAELPHRLDELEPHRSDPVLVVHCRGGGRSARAVEFLRQQGFTNAVNLKGGIHAWSDEIDPSLPKP